MRMYKLGKGIGVTRIGVKHRKTYGIGGIGGIGVLKA